MKAVTTHTDLAPTILKLAGAPLSPELDGQPIPFQKEEVANFPSEHATIEYWGYAVGEGDYGWRNISGINYNIHLGNTYKGVRLISQHYSLYYSVWCTNEAELYDLKTDPYQTRNLFSPITSLDLNPLTIANRPLSQVVARLDALMMVVKSCKGYVCTHPWSYLHPTGAVVTLDEALNPYFDDFYGKQPKVQFEACALGYLKNLEGPLVANVFGGGDEKVLRGRGRKTFEYGERFHDIWT